MTHGRQLLRSATCLSILVLALLQTSQSSKNDYLFDVSSRVSPSSVSENTLRHIMQLVSLGTGLRVPSPVGFRYREKALKRARLSLPNTRSRDVVIGSEFLGKRSSDDERVSSVGKRMGSEFLGKRMGSEFLGKRMGSEFLGKRMGSEFLGKRMGSEFLGKRMGSEFLGKRMGSEFLGKRMGSEFLGKRMDSEYLDGRLDEVVDGHSGDRRVGSELPSKRGEEYEYKEEDGQTASSVERPDSIDSQSFVLSEDKRMGSEFLGRKRREVKTPESHLSAA